MVHAVQDEAHEVGHVQRFLGVHFLDLAEFGAVQQAQKVFAVELFD